MSLPLRDGVRTGPESIVEVTPEREEELLRAFLAMADPAPCSAEDACPLCALQERWRAEDEERRRAGA